MDQFKNVPTKAYVVHAAGSPFVMSDIVLDEVKEGEVLVELRYTGLCHTVCVGTFLSL